MCNKSATIKKIEVTIGILCRLFAMKNILLWFNGDKKHVIMIRRIFKKEDICPFLLNGLDAILISVCFNLLTWFVWERERKHSHFPVHSQIPATIRMDVEQN